MDCEKFDKVVLDFLYEELDELTSAAARRHMDQCARCRDIGNGLKATREVGALPMVAAPDGLEQRILAAERDARKQLSFGQRAGRAISVLAGYAMRPQLAMAALLLLMIGSSLVFLRAKPGDSGAVSVAEPAAAEKEAFAQAPALDEQPAPPAAAAPGGARAARGRAAAGADIEAQKNGPAEEPDDAVSGGNTDYDRAMAAYRAGRYAEAESAFQRVATENGPKAPSAALFAAQAARYGTGCRDAAPKFETVNSSFKGTGIAHEATWQAADCYRSLGEIGKARKHYASLTSVAGYKQRAERALATLGSDMVAAKRPADKPPAKSKAVDKKKQAAPPPSKPPSKK